MSIDPTQIGEWAKSGAIAIDFLKKAASLLPKGADKEKANEQIQEAEKALASADAAMAKELGFALCKCAFPPPIMLWKEAEKAMVCPKPDCGHAIHQGIKISTEALKAVSPPSTVTGWNRDRR